jgi:hypothetical protein
LIGKRPAVGLTLMLLPAAIHSHGRATVAKMKHSHITRVSAVCCLV